MKGSKLSLFSIEGDLKDRCQGVNADIATNPDPSYVRIFIGSAAGVYKGRKGSVLSKRIKEHLSSMKIGSRPESGMLHVEELKKAVVQPNFFV